MKTVWKWRLIFFITLVIINIIGVIVSYFFVQNIVITIITVVIIDGTISPLYKLIITPKLKEIEEKEKVKEKQEEKEGINRYDSIKKMIELLKKYEDIKDNNLKEMECTQELGDFFPELLIIGFRFNSDRKTTVKNKNYEVIFKPKPVTHTFLIRKLENGMRRKEPFEQYFSRRYPQSETDQSDPQVLYDFITHIKEIIGMRKKPQENKKSLKAIDLQGLINLLRINPKPPTIFTDIIFLFHKNDKLLNFLHSNRFITSDSVQMENNLWDFFTICRFEKSMISIKKANENKSYLYRENEDEKNTEIREDFINYILSK